MGQPIELTKTKHPHKALERKYAGLVGIEEHKNNLLFNLKLYLDKKQLKSWRQKHHPDGLPFLETGFRPSPLILLSGEVGCGKTEIARSIGTPLSKELGGRTVFSFMTPSDIRGKGAVGELSNRITASFREARNQLKGSAAGILIIDEADDLATERGQGQAHHEDRAGVNVLIKEIDRLEEEEVPIAVLLITNRKEVLDPAVLRRAATQLVFTRPNELTLRSLFQKVLEKVDWKEAELDRLTQVAAKKSPRFTYSDVLRRVGQQAVVRSWSRDEALSISTLLTIVHETQSTPEL